MGKGYNRSNKFLKKIKNKILVVHYASSRIDELPIRISSISVLDTSNSSRRTFSRSDSSEEELLSDFFSFIYSKYDKGFYFLGWNNKVSEYGLTALRRRYIEITRKKLVQKIPSEKIYDLDGLIKKGHKRAIGGLGSIAVLNNITTKNFVLGLRELDLFEKKLFRKIDLSTSRKVKIIHTLFELFLNNKLNLDFKKLKQIDFKKLNQQEKNKTIKSFKQIGNKTKDLVFLKIVLKNKKNIKSVVNEFKDCYSESLPRSTIVLAWALFMNFLYNFISKKGLKKFVNAYNRKYHPKTLLKAKKELEVCNAPDNRIIEVCFTLDYFSDKNIRKVYENCLDKRNLAGHVNNLVFNEGQIPAYLDDLVELVKLID